MSSKYTDENILFSGEFLSAGTKVPGDKSSTLCNLVPAFVRVSVSYVTVTGPGKITVSQSSLVGL